MFEQFSPLWLSIRVATSATLISIVFGAPIARRLARAKFRGKGLIAAALVLPMVLPPTVLGYELLWLFGPVGPLGRILERIFGATIVFRETGIVLAAVVSSFPLFLIPARAAFAAVDPALEDAARLLGRNETSVFLYITLPLAWRGLFAGALLSFARALGDFGATLMVGGNIKGVTRTASLELYDAISAGDFATARTLTWSISLAAIVAVLFAETNAERARGRS